VPARERAGLVAAPLGEHREELVGALDGLLLRDATGDGVGAHLEILGDRHRLEDLPPLGHVRDAARRPVGGIERQQILAFVRDSAALRGTTPEMTLNIVDLPAPFGPTIATICPSVTSRVTSRSAWMLP
jgi:hypothetical protein